MPDPKSHPLDDHRPDRPPPPPLKHSRPEDCPDPLCILPFKSPTVCERCPRQLDGTVKVAPVTASQPPPKKRHWGGRRRGAGAPKGNLNHLVHGHRSQLVKHAVDVLAEHKELRPFLLLIARAAVDGEIPQTTRRLILKSLGNTTLGMQKATLELRRLRHEPAKTR